LPVLVVLVGVAFLAENHRLLGASSARWWEVAPWLYVWLVVTAYIFLQPAVRELVPLQLTLNGIDIGNVHWLQPVKYWAHFTAYWLLAWVVSRQAGQSRSVVVIGLMAMALFQSLYGMVAFVGGQETILGIWPKTNYLGSVTGSFYNRNHLAGFLAVAMPIGAGYLLSSRRTTGRHGRMAASPNHHSQITNHRSRPLKFAGTIIFLLLTGAALIGTASRLGIFSGLIGFLLWGWLQARSEFASGPVRYAWLVLLVGLPLLAGLRFGPGYLVERLLQIDQATGRLGIWSAMLSAPGELWLHGAGAGAFHDVFKLIHPADHVKSVWRAHSEYLQFVFEFGLIGLAILMSVAVYWFKKCRPNSLDGVQRGALAGVVAILIHNIADFDMQIPGTAVAFWMAVGLLFSNGGSEMAGR